MLMAALTWLWPTADLTVFLCSWVTAVEDLAYPETSMWARVPSRWRWPISIVTANWIWQRRTRDQTIFQSCSARVAESLPRLEICRSTSSLSRSSPLMRTPTVSWTLSLQMLAPAVFRYSRVTVEANLLPPPDMQWAIDPLQLRPVILTATAKKTLLSQTLVPIA